jgi:glycosyltransferase involved in cell wall biosynthesis
LDRLIRAFELAAERMPDLRLVIAGGGTGGQESELRGLVAAAAHGERIELTGPVSAQHAAELMRGALLLAMPSRYEAWPLTALEAGAAGVPVVGSDIVGVRDAAPPYPSAHGILVPEGDVRALADALMKVAADGELREKAGATGHRWAARFTWDALATEQLAFYEELVRTRDE